MNLGTKIRLLAMIAIFAILYPSNTIAQCPSKGNISTVTTSEIWYTPSSTPWQLITVKNGGSLTIPTGVELKFIETGSIVIEPGGILILETCTLKSANLCNYWDGIYVNGISSPQGVQYSNVSTHALKIGNGADVGYCALKDALIMETLSGIQSLDGGIINAEDTKFEDCLTGVSVDDYTKYQSDLAYENACRFVNCSFKFDNSLGYGTFSSFTCGFFRDVNGIVIESCDFECTYSSNLDDRGIGIEADNASVWVTSVLDRKSNSWGKGEINRTGEPKCPMYLNTANLSTFKHLSVGVYFYGSNSNIIGMNYCGITGCKNGVDIIGGTKHVLDNLNFVTLSGNYKFSDPTTIGLPDFQVQLTETVNSLVYRSEFETNFDIPIVKLVDNGDNELEVSRCTLSNSYNVNYGMGIKVEGDNSGFFFRCNEFDNLKYDLHINSDGEVKINQYNIAYNNGNTHSSGAIANLHNDNAGHGQINYFHKAPTPSKGGIGQSLLNLVGKPIEFCPDYYCTDFPVSTKPMEYKNIDLYPNPTSGILYIYNSDNYDLDEQISVYDINGRVVTVFDTGIELLDITILNPGIYYIIIRDSQNEILLNKKVILIKR